MKGARGFLAVLCLLAAAPAVAGTVYRCDRADGVRSYSSKRIAGAGCVAVSSYKASRARTHAVTASPPAPSVGSATPANPVQGSPAQAVLRPAPALRRFMTDVRKNPSVSWGNSVSLEVQ